MGRCLFLGLVVLALVLVEADARACSRAICYGVAPWSDAGTPSSSPGIGFHPPTIFFTQTDASTQLTLDGGVVPATVTAEGVEVVIRPSAALVPATYEIRTDSWSTAQNCPPDAATVFPIDITTAAPLPTELGTLHVARSGSSSEEHQTGCTSSGASAFVDLAIDLAAAAVPFASSFRFTTTVDGVVWQRSAYGSMEAAEPTGYFRDPRIDQVFAACDGSSLVVPGHHTIAIVAHLAGGADLPAATIEVDLICAAQGDASSDATSDAGSKNAGTGGCNCATASGEDQSRWQAFGAPVLAWLLIKRRRARRPK